MIEAKFTLTGITPLLMHKDNIEGEDLVNDWIEMDKAKPKESRTSKAGDDRTPPWKWQIYLYHDKEGNIALPFENLIACLVESGNRLIQKGRTTYKKVVPSAVFAKTKEAFFAFTVNKKPVPMKAIEDIANDSFSDQCRKVKGMGFNLFAKRAGIGTNKHVRVRPKFDQWEVSGVIDFQESKIPKKDLAKIFDIAGSEIGLGDWRPSSPQKPGQYGLFDAKLEFRK